MAWQEAEKARKTETDAEEKSCHDLVQEVGEMKNQGAYEGNDKVREC